MDRDVKSHELPELWVSEVHLVGKVCSVVKCSISGSDFLIVTILIGVNNCSDSVNLSTNIEAVLIGGFPVFSLVYTVSIGLSKV